VNGTARSVNFGQNSTAASIASNLATQIGNCSGLPVRASALDGTVTLIGCTPGANTNYTLSTSRT
jgi:phage tail sheath gpL-like